MINKTTIIAGAVGVLAIAGIVYWLMPETSPTSSPQGNSSNFGGFYQSTVTAEPGSSGQQASGGQAPTAPDLDSAYGALLQKLSARKINFARVSSTAGAEGSVYALFAADVAEAKKSFPNAKDFSLGVALADISDDGVPEALVFDDMPGSCGTAGCLFGIYRKTATSWLPIFELQVQSVALANVVTNGHTDLFLGIQGNQGYQTNIRRYAWEDNGYRYKELVATWNGTAFVTYK